MLTPAAPTSASTQTDLLRLVTMGSVDDGKSTLIGRLLLDNQALPHDQLQALTHPENALPDLALFTDGLKAEREQGITIDVAFRYFSSASRRYILADCPGHLQYTRNLVTGASTAEVALIMVDAQKGITEQTRRHLFIATLLRLKKLILCVNKMDLVNYDEKVFEQHKTEAETLLKNTDATELLAVPMSALQGENVVNASGKMPWFKGRPLFEALETLNLPVEEATALRLPVQMVFRPPVGHTNRFYAGSLASGNLKVGQKVTVLPSNLSTQIREIQTFDGPLAEASAGEAITFSVTDELDISRGDMLAGETDLPPIRQELEAMVCWMHNAPLQTGDRLLLMHTTSQTKCIVQELTFKINLQNLLPDPAGELLHFNDIGKIKLKLANPICADTYKANRITGSFILIEERTNQTVAAGMIG